MAITVYFSERLRGRTGGDAEITVEGATLGQNFRELTRSTLVLKATYIAYQSFRDHIAVAINGNTDRRIVLDLPLADGDKISFVAAAKGG